MTSESRKAAPTGALERQLSQLRACAAQAAREGADDSACAALRKVAEGLSGAAAHAGFAEAARGAASLAVLIDRLMASGQWDASRIATLISLVSTLFSPEIRPGSEIACALATTAAELVTGG